MLGTQHSARLDLCKDDVKRVLRAHLLNCFALTQHVRVETQSPKCSVPHWAFRSFVSTRSHCHTLPVVGAVNGKMRIQGTKKSSNGRIGSAERVPVKKQPFYFQAMTCMQLWGQDIKVQKSRRKPDTLSNAGQGPCMPRTQIPGQDNTSYVPMKGYSRMLGNRLGEGELEWGGAGCRWRVGVGWSSLQTLKCTHVCPFWSLPSLFLFSSYVTKDRILVFSATLSSHNADRCQQYHFGCNVDMKTAHDNLICSLAQYKRPRHRDLGFGL